MGLTNLGATCYLNTLLQCLFMNSHFRHTIYLHQSPQPQSLSGQASNDAVVLLLQRLFGLMEYGPQSYVSPEAIVNELGVKHYVQQDVNEFNNLFLSKLEGELRECAGDSDSAERVKQLVTSEFAGETVSTVTSECGHSSQRPSSFVDVSLLIRGKKTLQHCLDAFIESEQLTARNAYFCSMCQCKRDAEKQTRFSALPPVLNLQLIRFHYDVDSGQKKKLNDRIFIPYRLNMQPYMTSGGSDGGTEAAEQYEYELTGVLRHKGASAHRGHYTCEVRDAKGKWWIFDDEKVGLGGDKFNAKGDAAGAQARAEKEDDSKEGGDASGKVTKKKRRKQQSLTMKKQRRLEKEEEEGKGQHKLTDYMDRAKRDGDDDDDDVVLMDAEERDREIHRKDDKDNEGETEDVVLDEKREVEGQRKGIDGDWSSNAYMLVYTRRSRVLDDAKAAEAAERQRANSPQCEEKDAVPNGHLTSVAVAPPSFICDCHTDCQPPPSVKKAIEMSAAKLSDDIRVYDKRKKLLMEKIEQRKAEVESLLDELDAPPITPPTATEYEQQHRHPNQPSPYRRVERKRQRQVVVDDVMVQLDSEQDDEEEAVAEPFNFIHLGWLQRWLNGQTEREWSDEMAERAVTEVRGRRASKAAVEGGDKGDAIVVDGEEDGSERDTRESPVPDESGAVIVLSDDDEQQRSASPTDIFPHPSSSASSPPRSSPTPASASSTSQFDTDDPLWPGDIFESCARLLCPHNKLDPRLHKLRLAKRISSAAWSRLMKENVAAQREKAQFLVDAGLSSSPEPRLSVDLDDSSLCAECVTELQAESNQLSAQRSQYEALVEGMKEFTSQAARSQSAFKSGQLSDTSMLLDRDWYKQFAEQVRKWRGKAYSSVPLPSTNSDDINSGLLCPHGELRVHFDQHAFLISPHLWERFAELYPSSTVLPANLFVCEECNEAAKSDSRLRHKRAIELTYEQEKHKFGNFLRQRHDLFPDPKRPPHSTRPNQPYYLLPARWVLHKFLPYHEQCTVDSSKPLVDAPPPAPMDELFCEHGKLKFNPVPKGVGGELGGIEMGEVTYCEAATWRGLVYATHVAKNAMCATFGLQDVVDDNIASSDAWQNVIVQLTPPPCDVCIKARQQLENHRLHQFTRGSLTVRRVSKTTPIGSAPTSATTTSGESQTFASASSSRFTAAPPTSPRSRSRRKRTYNTLEELDVYDVNCSDDVATLKMKISQYCTHNPAHMRLFWRDGELMEGKKLSDYGVTDGGELIMKVDAEVCADAWGVDYMDYLPTDDALVSGDVESGFAGTRLGGGGGSEGNKTVKAGTTALAPAATREMMQNAAKQHGVSSSSSVERATAAKEQSKEESREQQVASHQRAHDSAPVLPRIDESTALVSTTATESTATTTAPSASSPDHATPVSAATRPTVAGKLSATASSGTSTSPFLASLRQSQRSKTVPAKVVTSRQHSEETKDNVTSIARDEDEQGRSWRLAQELQLQFDQEAKEDTASSSSRATGESTDRLKRLAQLRMQEKEDREIALKLSKETQHRTRAVEEEEAGIGGEENEEDEEDEEDEDGDYSEEEERKERKKRQQRKSSGKRRQPQPATRPAQRVDRRKAPVSATRQDDHRRLQAVPSETAVKCPPRTRVQAVAERDSDSDDGTAGSEDASDQPTPPPKHYTRAPIAFVCVMCTFENASGKVCTMCNAPRPKLLSGLDVV